MSQMLVEYTNPGELDIRAITILGMSAKPNSTNPIGEFGTGLKYAVAVLMSHDAAITIHDGAGNTYIIHKVTTNFRGQDFEQLELRQANRADPIVLPFTTHYGKNWELWQVMRELECNARDEGGGSRFIERHDAVAPPLGTVSIIIDCAAYSDTVMNEGAHTFFDALKSESPVDAHTVSDDESMEALARSSEHFYCRGIRVFDSITLPMAFTYNYRLPMYLSEDRTAPHYAVADRIGKFIMENSDKYLINHVLGAECSFEFQYCLAGNVGSWSPEFLEVATERVRNHKIVPSNVLHAVTRRIVDEEMRKRYDTTEREDRMLARAIKICKAEDYDVDDYSIQVVPVLPNSALGMADLSSNTIFLSRTCFELGLETIIGTLIEEWLHLARGMTDESRNMQDWLLRQLVVRIMETYE